MGWATPARSRPHTAAPRNYGRARCPSARSRPCPAWTVLVTHKTAWTPGTLPLPRRGAGWAGGRLTVPQRRRGAIGIGQPLPYDLLGDLRGFGFRELPEAVDGDRGDDREDAPGQVGAAGRRVVVGRVVQRLHAGEHGVSGLHAVGVELLQRAPGEQGSRADGVESLFLIRAAGHVVAEDPSLGTVLV